MKLNSFNANHTGMMRGRRVATSAIFGMLMVAATAHAADLFTSFNPYGVLNSPKNIPYFTVTGNGWNVTQLQTYHWNNGQGTPVVGKIHLYNAQLGLIGSFQAIGVNGQGNARNVNWVANLNMNLTPGRYAIADDSIATWSYNAQSGNAGFIIVRGTLLAQPTVTTATPPKAPVVVPVSNPQTPVPFNGDCRGTGCTHPDLRPQGGNGPAGATNISRHLPVPRIYKFIEFLTPSMSFAAEAAKCQNQFRGFLTLLDDEPYYYYFTGRYARVVCQ